jgi:phage portal protein BeeE
MGLTDWGNAQQLDVSSMVPQGISFFSYNNEVQWERVATAMDYKRIFELCSPLAAIVAKKASAFANGKLQFIKATTGGEIRGLDKQWKKLFDRPNLMQTGTEFLIQLYIFMAMRGYCYGYPIYPEGFTDIPSAIWLLPPWYVTVAPINNPFFQFQNGAIERQVIFQWNGETTQIPESELILFKDPGSTLINQYTWLPESRIMSLQRPISTLIAAIESRNVLVTRRGALGLLSNDTGKGDVNYVPLNPDEKKELQRDYRQYGLTHNQWQLLITNANLKYQQMAMNVKELGLFEEHERDIMDICDVFNYPYELLANTKGQTYANKNEAGKKFYQDTIIPESKVITEQLEVGLKLSDVNIELELVYDDVEALQESMRDTGNGRLAMNNALAVQWENNLITLDDWREQIGDERLGTEPNMFYKYEFDQWMQTSGYAPQIELQIPGNEQPQKQTNAA